MMENVTLSPSDDGENVRWWSHVVVMPLLLAFGFTGNLLNLLTLWKGERRGLVGVSFVYLKGVALADLGAVLALVPFVLLEMGADFGGAYKWSFYQAHICVPLINAFMSANSLCIVALTMERYISICHPIYGHKLKGGAKRRAWQVMAGVWAVAFAFYIPQFLQKRVVVAEEGRGYRIERVYDVSAAYLVARELCCRFVPILLLSGLNARIILGFRRRAEKHRALVSSSSSGTRPSLLNIARGDRFEAEWSVYVLLVVTVVAFCLCNLPASLLSLFVALPQPEGNFEFQLFRAMANLGEVAGHAANFYLYCLCSSDYRRAFAEIFACPAYQNIAHLISKAERSGDTIQLQDSQATTPDAVHFY